MDVVDAADVARDRAAFRQYLREHGLPVTVQRLAVGDLVLGTDRHLSADDVRRELTGEGVHVGTATIYRTLDVLVQSGLVVERDFGEGFRRYEAARGVPHHEHLLCTSCGRVMEFHDERFEAMTDALARANGFLRQRHRLVIYGLCHACRHGS